MRRLLALRDPDLLVHRIGLDVEEPRALPVLGARRRGAAQVHDRRPRRDRARRSRARGRPCVSVAHHVEVGPAVGEAEAPHDVGEEARRRRRSRRCAPPSRDRTAARPSPRRRRRRSRARGGRAGSGSPARRRRPAGTGRRCRARAAAHDEAARSSSAARTASRCSRAKARRARPARRTAPARRCGRRRARRSTSARRTVERRCAMTNVVRPAISCSRPAMTSASVSASSADVGSSRIRIGASRRMARAIVMRCCSPSESVAPARRPPCRGPAGRRARKPSSCARRAARRDLRRASRRAGRRRCSRAGSSGRRAAAAAPCDLLAQRAQPELAHVDAVEQHAAARSGRRSAGSGSPACVLPAPVGPTMATSSPGAGVEGRRRCSTGAARRVAEADVLEA